MRLRLDLGESVQGTAMNGFLRAVFLLGFWFCLIGEVKAEHGCPQGHYPSSQPNGPVCMPIPGYTGPAARPIQQASEPVWETRWGAIAIPTRLKEETSELGEGIKNLGVARRKSSESLAEQRAMQDCQLQGDECRLMLTYRDQCGVVVWGDSQVAFASARTIDQAEEIAMKDCTQYSANCKLRYYDCSYPARVQ